MVRCGVEDEGLELSLPPSFRYTRIRFIPPMAASVSSSTLLQWPAERWRLLVLAAADVVLEAREKQLPQKEQLSSAQVIHGQALQLLLPQARAARVELADHARFVDGVRQRMAGSADAHACLSAAFAGCRMEPVAIPASRCAITAEEGASAWVVIGNRNPVTGAPGRHETKCWLSPGAAHLLQACAVVGNFREWLDQHVDAELQEVRFLSRPDELDRLVETLQPRIIGFHRAAVGIYSYVMGPPPQSAEQMRQDALRVWEKQTDLATLLATAHAVLWPEELARWEQPTAVLSTPKALRRAYKKLVTLVHPDKVQRPEHKEEAQRMFRTLQAAYEAATAASIQQ